MWLFRTVKTVHFKFDAVQEWIVIRMCLVNVIVPSGLLIFAIPLYLIKAMDNCQIVH